MKMSKPKEYGIVKIYYPLKGYGFITREHGKDLFFLRSSLDDEARIFEGSRVQFLVQKDGDKDKHMAVNISRID
ncbi:cold shock domain-containing protein [Chitinimonas taiwanensis]|jgi:CspA family cold shock protein|uniref:cold shock domain-containing protein n=1 Tax=Chitinimonas taiwanensis TaxID=240412 RepID=UPI0035AEE7AA